MGSLLSFKQLSFRCVFICAEKESSELIKILSSVQSLFNQRARQCYTVSQVYTLLILSLKQREILSWDKLTEIPAFSTLLSLLSMQGLALQRRLKRSFTNRRFDALQIFEFVSASRVVHSCSLFKMDSLDSYPRLSAFSERNRYCLSLSFYKKTKV